MTSKIKDFALKNDVPIINDEGLAFIINKIKQYNIKTILEIGTAIGYSAISFTMNGASVTSVERNDLMHELAVKHVNELALNDKITLIHDDALTTELVTGKFDLIFIDAAKAQYEKFFNKYEKHLNEGGIIICDNLNFHNLDITKVSRNTRQLLGKIDRFKEFLRNNEHFSTTFYDDGDGMSVSIKNEKTSNDF
ncbi:MAG TPA: O-methyltransferase [Haploplasma sp.]|nr:O-methyltransferase [Haploplasma sp.]